ncbi:MAG TPA: hypothetical protein VFI17_00850 [Solirubrobacterales bacterium]|nr:hypothetical protein [Solirubrobacterales bacterium]
MLKRAKRFGMVLVASLAVVATGAQAASAANFVAGSYPAAISGNQIEKHVFETVANTLYCNTYDFQSELSGAANELALSASPSGCSTLGIVTMTVNMNGCTWNFNVGEKIEASKYSGSGHIACPSGKEIVWNASGGNCTAKIPAQTLSGTFTLEKTATKPTTVLLSTAATGIKYVLGPTSGCLGSPAPGTYENGAYSGTTTLLAKEPKSLTQINFGIE